LREAYKPLRDRKSGIPQDTPVDEYVKYRDIIEASRCRERDPTDAGSSQNDDMLRLANKSYGIGNGVIMWEFLA
jgi:hypothetical protein